MTDKHEQRKSPNIYELESKGVLESKRFVAKPMVDQTESYYREYIQGKMIMELTEAMAQAWSALTPEERVGKAWSLPKLEEVERNGVVYFEMSSHLLQYTQAEKPWMTVK